MRRLTLSVALGLVLAASLVLKVYGHGGSGKVGVDPGDEDIVALLHQHGFRTKRAPPNTDPVWIHGVRGDCRIDIANVSPQGWHRSIVEWHATGKSLQYSAMGTLHDQQPILKPMIVHYFGRLKRYLGIDAPGATVRAIVMTTECPAGVITSPELAALSD